MAPAPAVAVWADYWLPVSQTFVLNQMAAMTRWSPVGVGLSTIDGGLPVAPALAPFTRTLPSRLARRAFGTRAELPAYRELLRQREVVLLHAHFGPGAINLLPLARASGLPLVVTFHGYDVTQLPRRPGRAGRVYRRGLAAVFERADRLVAVSDHIRTCLVGLGAPADRIAVRHIGAPAPAPGPAPGSGAPAGTPDPPPRAGIVFVGRLIEKKGVADLLRAVARLPPELRTPLAVLGGGPLLGELRELAAGLGVTADFRGEVTPAQVAAALATARVFCAPSKTARDGDTEGLPTSVLEAAHHGVPIVTTRHAGIPEFVRDGREGLLVAEGDIAALGAALARVLQDPALAAGLAAAARTRARTDFEIGACTSRLEDLYDDVVSR